MDKHNKIKILVAYHKPAVLISDEILTPIHLGRAIANEKHKDSTLSQEELQWLSENMIGDDSGDNISHLNRNFCELTGIYWAWKNQDKLNNPDYIGFMHYRRHFYFYDFKYYGKEFYSINNDYLQSINYCNKTIEKITTNYDIISNIPSEVSSCYEQYKQSPSHKIKDLDCALEILAEKYPNFKVISQDYMQSKESLFCNMFIMKKEFFNNYCEWLFDILFELHKKIDTRGYSIEEERAAAFIAERLTGVYMKYLSENKKLRYKQYPIAIVKNTDIGFHIKPSFNKNNIPICFSADNNYIPYLGVAIKSVIENSSTKNNYDIIIIDEDISSHNKSLLTEIIKGYSNFKIRFIDVNTYTKNLAEDTFYTCAWYEKSTYYRFFIQDMLKFYDKVIYLDSDIIVLSDVAELFKTDLEDKLIGAAEDIEMSRWLKTNNKNSIISYHRRYGIKDSSKYFQAGILLFNLKLMRKENTAEKLFEKLAIVKTPFCVDQDILNMVCYDRVKYFDVSWNIEWITLLRSTNLIKDLSKNNYYKFIDALENPKIIHYCDSIKPWQEPQHELAHYFWHYAKMTPFYELILFSNLEKKKSKESESKDKTKKLKARTLNYIKYTILASITKGKKQRQYREKRNSLKAEIRQSKGLKN